MAHMIDESNGRASCMVAGQPAWHGLGVVVAEAQTSAEAIRLANLDWTVNKVSLLVWNSTAESYGDVPDFFGMQRSDTDAILGVVGTQYEPLQNASAFEFLDGLLGKDVTRFETAGAIKDGRVVWMLAKLPGDFTVGGKDDRVLPYMLLTNSHDGSRAVQILPTTVRVVCNNTLGMALYEGRRTKTTFNMKHTKNLKDRVEEARKALGLIAHATRKFAEQADVLAATAVNDAAAADYFKTVFEPKTFGETAAQAAGQLGKAVTRGIITSDEAAGAALLGQILDGRQANQEIVAGLLKADEEFTERQKRNERELLDHLIANFQADQAAGTAWGALNAVTEYVDHQQRRNSAESRFSAAVLGDGARVKAEAFRQAMSLAV
jgi:phage/plasmid-like protein (TIGR03299 family)